MAYSIDWSTSAQEDLKELVQYIALDDPNTAERFGLAIIKKIEDARDFPKTSRIVPEYQNPNIRELILNPYRIILNLDHNSSKLFVLRIWHAARGKPTI